MSLPNGFKSETIKLNSFRIELERAGKGLPVLLLHSEEGYELAGSGRAIAEMLAQTHEVYLPRIPGFGKSSLPDSIRSIDDISYLWLDLLDRLDLENVNVVGFSVGAWLALEIATKSCARLKSLVLCGSVGVKFGGAYDRDIEDIYFHSSAEVRAMRFHNAAADPHFDLTNLSRQNALVHARQRETIAKFCWDPYFHSPSLRHRLGRVKVPSLVVHGTKDRITKTKYGRALARTLPDAQYIGIPQTGHFPHIECPEAFVVAIDQFWSSTSDLN